MARAEAEPCGFCVLAVEGFWNSVDPEVLEGQEETTQGVSCRQKVTGREDAWDLRVVLKELMLPMIVLEISPKPSAEHNLYLLPHSFCASGIWKWLR